MSDKPPEPYESRVYTWANFQDVNDWYAVTPPAPGELVFVQSDYDGLEGLYQWNGEEWKPVNKAEWNRESW